MENTKHASKLMQNKFTFIILVLSASLIYGLPYFRSYYYDAYRAAYSLTNTQMGSLGSIYGIFGLVSYLLGGILADRISSRKLISFSLIGTGIGGLIHLGHPSYSILICIYSFWGITSLLTFWPAFVKGIRLLANTDEQGKAFGLMEGGRGAINAIHLAITLAIFGYLTKSASQLAGLNGVILFYSVLLLILGIFTFLLLKDSKNEILPKFEFKNVIRLLKMPTIWLITIILCSTYTMNMSYFYFTPYATNIFKTTAVFGAIIGILSQYVRPFASPLGGIIGDKISCVKVLMIGFPVMIVGTALTIFLPAKASNIPLLTICVVLIYIAMYWNYGVIFSLLEEGNIPIELSGLAVGVIATLGYLPEVFTPYFAGVTLDAYTGVTGYRYYFMGVIVLLIIGFITTIVWSKMVTHSKTYSNEKTVTLS